MGVLAFLTNSLHAGDGADSSAVGMWSGLHVVHDGVALMNG